MSDNTLSTSIEYLKGVGPKRAEVLRSELGVTTFNDLLKHFPFRYIDKTSFHKISDIASEMEPVQLIGQFIRVKEIGVGRKMRLSAIFEDQSGQIELVWFKGAKWVKPKLLANKQFVVYGRPKYYGGKWNIPHPDFELKADIDKKGGSRFVPVYPSTEKLGSMGLNSNGIVKLMQQLMPQVINEIKETLPRELLAKERLVSRNQAFQWVHFPDSMDDALRARGRMKFEELLLIQILLLQQKIVNTTRMPGVRFSKVGDFFNRFYNDHLGFELTGAQKRVMKEIRADVNSGHHMNRLIQGDVGSGKTIVALLAGLLAIDNGFQVCLMAPTEILAQQHYTGFLELLSPLGLNVQLLTGSVKTQKRREIHEGLENGEVHVLIGTHALIEPKVKFQNLGLAIIDEQHRFGVKQRAKLWAKSSIPPHILVMTATPIPRTLSMTLYGDLDVSVIDELPPGRKQVKTVHRTDAHRLTIFHFLKEEIAKGRQVYIVYPLIEESSAMDYKDLMDGYESVSRSFPAPDYQLSIVHGKMKPEDKDFEMQRFVSGQTQIMVATTVIEVGVNVPNATVMVIESSERFGLSQLHQLRGRVGRGGEQSFCILMTGDKLSQDSRKRIKTMCDTTDGFVIAEVDLELRGPGDIMGTQQSGVMDLKIADLVKDQHILERAREVATGILDLDPDLEKPENKTLRDSIKKILKFKKNWSKIS
ncbi:MAG: ATP-dependent DNA helicase RecG [Flavobacteriales bacterium]|nr:ATP-dependent DNA helicase RecG [Flavobacteriales bacterium]